MSLPLTPVDSPAVLLDVLPIMVAVDAQLLSSALHIDVRQSLWQIHGAVRALLWNEELELPPQPTRLAQHLIQALNSASSPTFGRARIARIRPHRPVLSIGNAA